MHLLRCTFAVVLVIVSSVPSLPQQTSTTVQRDPQALALAAGSVSLMGGSSATSYGTVLASGSVTIAGIDSGPLPITLKSMGPRTLRSEIQLPKGLNVLILNNGQGAIKRPDGSVKRLQLYNTLAFRAEFIPCLSLLSENADTQVSIRKLNDVVVQGQPADVVELNLELQTGAIGDFLRAATRQRYFISKLNGLVLALEYDNYSENNSNSKVGTQILYSDYRLVSGVWVPFHQETYSDGKLESTLALSSVTFGAGLSPTEFDLPAEVKQ